MRSIKDFENKKISENDAIILRGGKKLRDTTPGKGMDVTTVDRNGQVTKYVTGAGLFDGHKRD